MQGRHDTEHYLLDLPVILHRKHTARKVVHCPRLPDRFFEKDTVQAIGIVNADESCKRVLVVCPASLKRNWERELTRWLVRPLRVEPEEQRSD